MQSDVYATAAGGGGDGTGVKIVVNPAASPSAGASPEMSSMPYPKSLILGRKITASPLLNIGWQMLALWGGISLPIARLFAAHTAEENNSELAWIFDMTLAVNFAAISYCVNGLRCAVCIDGGLHKLGAADNNPVQLTKASQKTLARWKWLLVFLTVFMVVPGLLNFHVVLTKIGTRSKLTGRIITPLYGYTVILSGALCFVFYMGPICFNWIFSMQLGALLVGENVSRVASKLRATKVGSPEWESEVVAMMRMLTENTLPLFSDVFGQTLGAITLGMWTAALGFFASYLEGGRIHALLLLVFCTFVPFGLCATISATSDKCDDLRAEINKKRRDDLGSRTDTVELMLTKLEKYTDKMNRGQGLGIVVCEFGPPGSAPWVSRSFRSTVRSKISRLPMCAVGLVLDAGMMGKIFSTLVGILVTVVPIIVALHGSSDTMGALCLTASQHQAVAGSLASCNCTSADNMTLNLLIGA